MTTERASTGRSLLNEVVLIGGALGLMLVGLYSADRVYDFNTGPPNLPPKIEMVDEDHMIRRSYIPHRSFFRSANQWFDRVIETYEKQFDGTFDLVERETVYYHYPFMYLGLGKMTTITQLERF